MIENSILKLFWMFLKYEQESRNITFIVTYMHNFKKLTVFFNNKTFLLFCALIIHCSQKLA